MPEIKVSRTTYEMIKQRRIGNAWNDSEVTFNGDGTVSFNIANDIHSVLKDAPEEQILRLLRQFPKQ